MSPDAFDKLSSNACPCGSTEEFESCCSPYISGNRLAPTAEALMRSRYTAFTLGDLDYIESTITEHASQWWRRLNRVWDAVVSST